MRLVVDGIVAMVTSCPRESLGQVSFHSRYAEVPQNAHSRGRLIQRVEMQSRHARTQQLLALFGGVINAELGGIVVVGQGTQLRVKGGRDLCTANLRELPNP